MKNIYYRKGRPVEGKTAVEGLARPDMPGVFETLRVYGGCFFRAEEHYDRLLESAQTAGFLLQGKKKLNLSRIRREVEAAVASFGRQEAVVRVTWTGEELIVMVGERRPPEELYRTGVALQTSPLKRSHSNAAAPEAKTTDYMNALAATLEPRPADIYEWVFLDALGYVTEVRIGNLFIIDARKRLRTPPLQGILNGVTRRFVIECALFAGLEVREEPLTRHEIYTAKEAFLTNTSWEIMPVNSLDRRVIGNEIPGPVTCRLQQIFKKRVQSECRPSKSSAH